MIQVKHKRWANRIFNIYLKRLLKKSFHSLELIGDVPQVKNKPILLLTNHSSWWDGFFTYIINRKYFQKKFHIMMLENQLKRFYFFNYLGAFSINQDSPKDIIKSLEYSQKLLGDNNNLVNIYPEGEMQFGFKNKVNFRAGIGRILKEVKNVQILLLAMKIHHLHKEKPQVFFCFDEVNKYKSIDDLESKMNDLLINIDNNIAYSKVIFKGRKSKGE